MPVYRVCKIPNFARDRRLSYKARGLLAFILSHDNDWEVHVETLINESDEDGRASVQTGLQELTKLGYATLEIERDTHGQVRGKQYCIYDTPGHVPKHRQTENQVLGSSAPTDRKSGSRFVGEVVGVVTRDDRQTENQVLGSSVSENDRQTINQDLGSTINQDLRPKETTKDENLIPSPLPLGERMGVSHTDEQQGQPKPKKAQRQPNTFYSPGFERMWVVLPPGRKIGKVETFTLWRERDLEPRTDEIIEKIERLKVTIWLDKPLRYIPMPETWFNKARYEDELVPLGIIDMESAEQLHPPIYVDQKREREAREIQKFLQGGADARSAGPRDVFDRDEPVIDGIEYHVDR